MPQQGQDVDSQSSRSQARLMNIRETWMARGIELDYRPAQTRMLKIADAVTLGAKFGMAESNAKLIALEVADVASEYQGFAWEGVAMAWTLADLGRGITRLEKMRASALASVHHNWRNWIWVGLGLALSHGMGSKSPAGLARLVELTLNTEDAQSANLIADGAGYALGAAQPNVWTEGRANPFELGDTSSDLRTILSARRGFDQGIGRAIWFLDCGEPEKILHTMNRFTNSAREADIWGGVGYAGTFSGGAPASNWHPLVAQLQKQTGTHGWLSQAAACAANARQRTESPDSESMAACSATWGQHPTQVIESMKRWMKDSKSQSPALAPGDWRHCRVDLEFGTL